MSSHLHKFFIAANHIRSTQYNASLTMPFGLANAISLSLPLYERYPRRARFDLLGNC